MTFCLREFCNERQDVILTRCAQRQIIYILQNMTRVCGRSGMVCLVWITLKF